MLEFLTESPMPELLLLLGGLLGVAIALLGNDRRTTVDNIARVLGLFVGALLMAMSAVMLWDGIGAMSTWLIGFLLGIALFFKIFKKVPVALMLAFMLAAIAAFFLYEAGISTTIVAVVALIVLVLVFVLTRFVEFIADLVGRILGLRPVLFVLGILGMIEAALLFMDSSLTTFTGL
ncbi:MAG: hypothetical protein LUQ16_03240 [Methanomassiliicoccales archaeon]|nr:hypothetical protein [Methanomassiliicoccales archaeon]MDD1756641.1 hypothetical protein [Methanomassiliicoccales archaeon]